MTDTDTTVEPEAEAPETEARAAIDAAHEVATAVVDNVEGVMVGQRETVEHAVTAILAGGHVLLEDVPGVGKTMLARSIAGSVDGNFKRVQFTPDLLPSDVTGVNVFNQKTSEFEFRPGPVFANVVLGDEINRAPPKTQSALLEAMEERQVTVDGESHGLPDPFTVIATQNTVEGDRAYDLPMAEIDRFMKKLSLGYPDHEEETDLLRRVSGRHPIEDLQPVATLADLRDARQATDRMTVSDHVRAYVTRLAAHTRENAQLGVSPRGSIALLQAARARALLAGRQYVIPDDVQAEAVVVLPHRIRTGGERTGAELVEDALESVDAE
jgi:MoxR-like ATPase